MLKLAVCVSGGGTNLQAIIDRIEDGTIQGARIVRVISNNPRAYALERARQAGIEGICVSPRQYETRDLFNAVIEAFRGRIINIHPALIPSFCGKGYYGLKVHERALERGVKVSGATVHFVDEGLDSGPIILQKAVEILDGDTAEVLQKRIMEQAEWIILPRAISLIAQGRVVIEGRTTRILPERR